MALAKDLFLRGLRSVRAGYLEIVCAGGTHAFGDPASDLKARAFVHNERFFSRALLGGETAMGESYMDGDWSAEDLVALVRFAVRNVEVLENGHAWLSRPLRWIDRLRHRLRSNTVEGSRENIRAHYDLSNEFFALFLDRTMMYSSGWYRGESDSLEDAQREKVDRICRKLDLRPGDHVLEIGTGWGGFALHAALEYGARVTTTTISREQHALAARRFAVAGVEDRVTLLLEDYRKLTGQFDKIVSIEMFEAVGLEHYDTFFAACDRLLEPEGSMVLQTITMNEQRFPRFRKEADWIQKYIFPGSELASVSEIVKSLGRATKLSLYHFEDFGMHYGRTLADWRERFWASIGEVRGQGFDDRFVNMWDYYLAYCEGAFRERHIGVAQIMLTKLGNPSRLWGETGEPAMTAGVSVVTARLPEIRGSMPAPPARHYSQSA